MEIVRRGPRPRGSALVAALAPILAVAVAACGSSGGTSTGAAGTGSSAASGSGAAKLTGSTFVIGSICDCTGAAASSQGGDPQLVTAWTDMVNNSGGINGHPVKVILKDTGSSPTTALQDAKELVQQDHVMAIVGEITNEDSTFQSYVQNAGVPVLGSADWGPAMATSPDFFPVGGDLNASFYGLATEAKKMGITKLAMMVCAEFTVCSQSITPFQKLLQNVVGGMSLVYSTKIAGTAPNYTASCIAAEQAGATGMFIEQVAAVTPRVADSCAQQNFKPAEFDQSSNMAAPPELQDPNLQGGTVIEYNLPMANTSTPGGRLFNESIDKYAPGLKSSPTYTPVLLTAWAGFELFRAVAQSAKLTLDSTPADVRNGLYGLKDETLGGLTAPLNYVKGKPTHIDCWWVDRIENGKLADIDNGKYSCVPPDKEAAFSKLYG